MNIFEAINNRHSVRVYKDAEIDEQTIKALNNAIDAINRQSGLHFQLFANETKGFSGKLKNVKNYIAFAGGLDENGEKIASDKLDVKIGYYGAQIMLEAQALGLNSCWVALSFNKSAVSSLMQLKNGEKVVNALAIGYGENQGRPHRSKPLEKLCKCDGAMPEWFKRGVEVAMLAPTAINQQQFVFVYENGKVSARAKLGPCNKIDLGIVEYYFEVGSGVKVFEV